MEQLFFSKVSWSKCASVLSLMYMESRSVTVSTIMAYGTLGSLWHISHSTGLNEWFNSIKEMPWKTTLTYAAFTHTAILSALYWLP